VQCTRPKSDRLFYLFIVVKISNFPVGPSSANGGRGGDSFFSAHGIIAAATLQTRGQYSGSRMTLMANIETMCPPSSPAAAVGRPTGPEPV